MWIKVQKIDADTRFTNRKGRWLALEHEAAMCNNKMWVGYILQLRQPPRGTGELWMSFVSVPHCREALQALPQPWIHRQKRCPLLLGNNSYAKSTPRVLTSDERLEMMGVSSICPGGILEEPR